MKKFKIDKSKGDTFKDLQKKWGEAKECTPEEEQKVRDIIAKIKKEPDGCEIK